MLTVKNVVPRGLLQSEASRFLPQWKQPPSRGTWRQGMATRTVRLTKEGFERLQANLKQEYVRLEEATRILRELTGSSDDYDDSGLEEAKQEKGRIENRIDDLEDQLARAEIIHNTDRSMVELGDVVVLEDTGAKVEMRVQVVSPIEAGVLEGDIPKVSDESPLGKALIGRSVGESFDLVMASSKKRYKILKLG
jgi:transcription elongation factor GreA